MAEYVQLKLEDKVSLLRSLFYSNLLTGDEIKLYKNDLNHMYHTCQKPSRTLVDYCKLIDRERDMLTLLESRRKKIGFQDKKEDLEERIKNDISKYFGWAKMFFNQDIDLLLKEIDVYSILEWNTKLKQAIEEAIPIHGNNSPGLWLRAVQYEILHGGRRNRNKNEADNKIRSIFVRAIRQHERVERLYLEFLYFEWNRISMELNNEPDEKKRKETAEIACNIGTNIYLEAKKKCDTKDGTFYKHILALADRFDFTKNFKDYVISDVEQIKDDKTFKFISLYKVQRTNNISDFIKRFDDQIENKDTEGHVQYETLLDFIYESFTLHGKLIATLENMSAVLKLCNKAEEKKLFNEKCYSIWIKLSEHFFKLFGPNGIKNIGNIYKSNETIISLFYSQCPESFHAASEYTILKLNEESCATSGEKRIIELLKLLESKEYTEDDTNLVRQIKRIFLALITRVPNPNMKQSKLAEQKRQPEFFLRHFPCRKFPMVCDRMISMYIEHFIHRLELGNLGSVGNEVIKKMESLYKEHVGKFGYQSFRAIIRYEGCFINNDIISNATPVSQEKLGKDKKTVDEVPMTNYNFSKIVKIFDDWTSMLGKSQIEPWIEYLRFIQQHKNHFPSNKYHVVNKRAVNFLNASLTHNYYIEEMKLHQDQPMNGH